MMEAEATNPFAHRTLTILIVLGVMLAIGFLLLSGFGQDIDRDLAGKAPVMQRTGNGFYGLYRLVDGAKGTSFLVDNSDEYDDPALMVLTPEGNTSRDDIDRILKARVDRPTLIVLPKWQVEPLPLQRNRVQIVTWTDFTPIADLLPDGTELIRETIDADTAKPSYGGPTVPLAFNDIQAIAGKSLRPMIATKKGALLAQIGNRPVYILADPDVINNQALKTEHGALAALTLLAALEPKTPGVVGFDTTLHYAPGERNLIKMMFMPPFAAVTIALFAAAILAGLAGASRFGPVRREGRAVALGKRALIDNVAALTRLSGKTALAGSHYADSVRDRVLKQMRAPENLNDTERDAWLDKISPPGKRFTDLDRRLRTARKEADMLRAAQAIDEWRKEVTA